jgi:hypothetical protein
MSIPLFGAVLGNPLIDRFIAAVMAIYYGSLYFATLFEPTQYAVHLISWLSVALAFIVSGTGVAVSCPSQSGAS